VGAAFVTVGEAVEAAVAVGDVLLAAAVPAQVLAGIASVVVIDDDVCRAKIVRELYL
jgi:hypothetical protein